MAVPDPRERVSGLRPAAWVFLRARLIPAQFSCLRPFRVFPVPAALSPAFRIRPVQRHSQPTG